MNMKITIRETVESDLPDIFRIRTDPLIAIHQYRLTADDTLDFWRQQLFGDRRDAAVVFKCTTILDDQEVIGHISQHHLKRGDCVTCQCGFNLAPQHWGHGIMRMSLSRQFDAFFEEQGVDLVISDCFAGNRRCIRLLNRLGFQSIGMGLLARLLIAYQYRCLRWIRHFELTATDWRNHAAGRTG
jgi:RimJ/RimL family protein N-acetyltransferase